MHQMMITGAMCIIGRSGTVISRFPSIGITFSAMRRSSDLRPSHRLKRLRRSLGMNMR